MERTALQAKKAAMPAIAKLRPIMGLRTVSLLESTQRGGAFSASNCASKKYTPVQLRWMRPLFGFADHAASDARRGSGGRSSGDRVNHDRGSAVTENGVLVRTQRDVGRNDRGVPGSISGNDQRKIRDISGRHTRMVAMTRSSVEVRPRGLEVRRLALGVLMNMQGVLARRQALHIELDFYAVRSFAQQRGAHALALCVFDFHRNWFGSGRAPCVRSRKAAQSYGTHNTGNRFHRSSL